MYEDYTGVLRAFAVVAERWRSKWTRTWKMRWKQVFGGMSTGFRFSGIRL